MSYTKGYLPAAPDALVIDTRRMNAIVELAPDDGDVTVEAGCTWARRPAHEGFLAFGFETIGKMASAQVEMARTRLVAEGFGIDRSKAGHSASVDRINAGLKALRDVAAAQGLKSAVQVAAGGAAYLRAHNFTLNIVTEARSKEQLTEALAAPRAIGARHGLEIENAVPKAMRAEPFGPVRGMLGPNGERWAPIHAVFPLTSAQEAVEANDAYFAAKRGFMQEDGVVHSVMTMTVGSEFFLDPTCYWQDEITPLHVESLGEDVVRPWRDRPANPGARAAVIELRRGTQELYAGFGGASWQVERDYPFESALSPETQALAETLKSAVDPKGLMNPGALGLGT